MRSAPSASAQPAAAGRGDAGARPQVSIGYDTDAGGITWGLLDAIVRCSPGPIIGAGADRRIRVWNEAAALAFGYSAAEAIGRRAPQMLAVDPAAREALFQRALEGHTVRGVETRSRTKSGRVLEVQITLAPVHGPDGDTIGVVAMGQDMGAQRRVERELRHYLDHDPLTGLLNRARLTAEIERCITFNCSAGVEGALLTLDLDHFNLLNDSDGPAAGDRLLLFTADILRTYAGAADIVGRSGGDEFVLVLPNSNPAAALEVAQELRGRLAAYPEGPAHASIGVACCASDADLTADDVLAAADVALREAKAAGGDRAALFKTSAGAALAQVEQVRSAIAEERLVLYGQPVMELRTGEIASHELLVRMLGRDGELVMPAEFIPVAERFGLIGEIDLWVTAAGIEMAAQGRHVAVNLSGLSIGNRRLLELVAEAAAAGVDVGNVTFEITETAAIEMLPEAIDFSKALIALGSQISLDDFGTGFGSFTYLKHLQSSAVKIDVEFVRDLLVSGVDRQVVKSIVDISHALGKVTIAEGIEDGATLAAVKELGVEYAQGFHVGRPAPIAADSPPAG